jgi:predicted RNA polymerase sigma factor
VRPELCGEAVRLGRVLAALMPDEPEVHGLLALMEFQSSRLRARTGPTGAPVLLPDQDRRMWDRLLIGRGEAALARADQLASSRGPYTLQAAIAACHARTFRPEETDWGQVVALYTALARATPSPIIELNRAVAVSRASGPAEALALVDVLVRTGTLERYHLLYSVRGDLLDRLGRYDEAASEFERAAALATNQQERTLMIERAKVSRSAAPSELRTSGPPGARAIGHGGGAAS